MKTEQYEHTEILNMEYNLVINILAALNKTPTVIEAAKTLGIPEKTIHNWKLDYKIVFGREGRWITLTKKRFFSRKSVTDHRSRGLLAGYKPERQLCLT